MLLIETHGLSVRRQSNTLIGIPNRFLNLNRGQQEKTYGTSESQPQGVRLMAGIVCITGEAPKHAAADNGQSEDREIKDFTLHFVPAAPTCRLTLSAPSA